MKSIVWLGNSLGEVRRFSEPTRREIGYQLFKVQSGLDPSDWKLMNSIGAGVREIRIHRGNEYRVIYVATFKDAVYVLHAFAKKSGRTQQHDIELATLRFRQLLKLRKGKG